MEIKELQEYIVIVNQATEAAEKLSYELNRVTERLMPNANLVPAPSPVKAQDFADAIETGLKSRTNGNGRTKGRRGRPTGYMSEKTVKLLGKAEAAGTFRFGDIIKWGGNPATASNLYRRGHIKRLSRGLYKVA